MGAFIMFTRLQKSLYTESKVAMARACQVTFQFLHETTFATVIRGYHVYKTKWSSVIGEVLHLKPDTRIFFYKNLSFWVSSQFLTDLP